MAGLTILDVRNEVKRVLAAHLGTYQPLDTPAVNIGDALPAGQVPHGLEAVIAKIPDMRVEAHLGGGARLTRTWQITLKGWETDGGDLKLQPAAEAWAAEFPDTSPLSLPAAPDVGIIAVVKVELVEHVQI